MKLLGAGLKLLGAGLKLLEAVLKLLGAGLELLFGPGGRTRENQSEVTKLWEYTSASEGAKTVIVAEELLFSVLLACVLESGSPM